MGPDLYFKGTPPPPPKLILPPSPLKNNNNAVVFNKVVLPIDVQSVFGGPSPPPSP